MTWLADALAKAGFLAVTIDHHGNNYLHGSLPEGFTRCWERAIDLRYLIDYFTQKEDISSIGIAGFSLGGYAAATLVGARIDRARFEALMYGHVPPPPTPDFPDLITNLRARLSDAELAEWINEATADYSDSRVSAALLMAPAIGILIDEHSLAAIDRPVAVYWGDADEIAPPPDNAHRYASHIPGAQASSVGADAVHRDFTTEPPEGEPVRARLSHEAVAFFQHHLRRATNTRP
jgi:predicted dienelactone hydrolase